MAMIGTVRPSARSTPRPARLRAALAAVLTAALALAGCGTDIGGEGGGETLERLGELTRALGARPARGDGPPALEVVEVPDGPVLYAALPARGGESLLSVSGINGPVTTWRSSDDVSLGLRGPGVVVATRGLGHDLHIADAAGTAAALAAGRSAEGLHRRHRTIGGDGRLSDAAFRCSLHAAGRETVQIGRTARPALRFEERCEGAGRAFTNLYWRDPARPLLWQSQQSLTPEVGAIRLQRLVE